MLRATAAYRKLGPVPSQSVDPDERESCSGEQSSESSDQAGTYPTMESWYLYTRLGIQFYLQPPARYLSSLLIIVIIIIIGLLQYREFSKRHIVSLDLLHTYQHIY